MSFDIPQQQQMNNWKENAGFKSTKQTLDTSNDTAKSTVNDTPTNKTVVQVRNITFRDQNGSFGRATTMGVP